jgi:hypothetical protein
VPAHQKAALDDGQWRGPVASFAFQDSKLEAGHALSLKKAVGKPHMLSGD